MIRNHLFDGTKDQAFFKKNEKTIYKVNLFDQG